MDRYGGIGYLEREIMEDRRLKKINKKNEREERVCRACRCILFTSSDDCPNCGIIFVPREPKMTHVVKEVLMPCMNERKLVYLSKQRDVEGEFFSQTGECANASLVQPRVPCAMKEDIVSLVEVEDDVMLKDVVPNSDGVVSLIAYGNEVIVVTDDGELPMRVVRDGAKSTVEILARKLCGKNVYGIKKFGEVFIRGVVHFVYVVPYGNCVGGTPMRTATLAEALAKYETMDCLRSVLRVYPLLARLHVHYDSLIDDEGVQDVTELISQYHYRPMTVMISLVARCAVKLNHLNRWMGMIGFRVTKKEMVRMLEDPVQAFVVSEGGMVSLDAVMLRDQRFDCFDRGEVRASREQRKRRGVPKGSLRKGWSDEYDDQIYPFYMKPPMMGDHDPYPRERLVDIFLRHPLVRMDSVSPGRRWMQLKYDPLTIVPCVHGVRCRVYCRGPVPESGGEEGVVVWAQNSSDESAEGGDSHGDDESDPEYWDSWIRGKEAQNGMRVRKKKKQKMDTIAKNGRKEMYKRKRAPSE